MRSLNLGNFDRLLRILLGLVLICLAAIGTIGAWGYVGALPLLTGVVAFALFHRIRNRHLRALGPVRCIARALIRIPCDRAYP